MDLLSVALWLGLAILVCYIIAMIFTTPYLVYFFCALKEKKSKPVTNAGVKTKFAVLLPARNEGDAIKPLLKSLKECDYPKDLLDVYVITETRSDPVYLFARQEGFYALAREDDTNGVKTKGGALDDAYRQIKKLGRTCDSYAIFDADNIISPEFFTEMDKLRGQGYKVCVGRRDFTNRSENWIAACSALMLTFTANYCSAGRKHLADKAFITGTGYCIDSSVVDGEGRWPWQGLGEDTQVNDYCLRRPEIRMGFTRFAPFYDEQPVDAKTMHSQHLRWMFGFFDVEYNDKTKKARIPHFLVRWEATLWAVAYIASLALTGIYLFTVIVLALAACFVALGQAGWLFLLAGGTLLFWLFEFDGVALTLTLADMNETPPLRIRLLAISTFFLYMMDYAVGFIEGFLFPSHRRHWQHIKHKGNG